MQGCPCGDCKMRFSENPECGPARRPPKRSRMRRARLRGPRQQEDRGPHARPGKGGGRGRRGPAARRHGGRARAFLPRMAAYASRRAPPASLVWSTDGLRTRLRKAEHCPCMARATIPPRAGRRHGRREGGRRRAAPLRLPEAKRRAGRACPASPRGGAADLNRAIKTASRSAWRKVGKKARHSAAHPKQRGQPAPQAPQQGGRKGLCLPGTIEEKGSRLVAGFVMFYSFIRRCMGPGEGAGRGRRPRHRRAQPAGRAHAQRVRGSRDQAAVERGAKGLFFLLPGRAALQKAANPRPRQAQRASARRLDQIFSSCLAGGPAAAREADAFIA